MHFQQELISWYSLNKRDLPWRNTKNPYLIWLSEIILQQTRVAQGLPYYERFVEQFPTLSDLAKASETDVLKLWEGLGYYSRGRNLHATAKFIFDNLNGVFPSDYDSLIRLKGIGAYTAAAVSSFSINERQAVVDGNVYRVLSRYFGVFDPIDSTSGKKIFSKLANELISEVDPGLFNQSIMEFGALVCKPKNPECMNCPVKLGCFAMVNDKIAELPQKSKKLIKKERFLNYFLVQNDDKVLVKQRESGDIWQGLFDFPLIEFDTKSIDFTSLTPHVFDDNKIENFKFIKSYKHVLTHQLLNVQFFKAPNINSTFIAENKLIWVSLEELVNLPKPRVVQQFISGYLEI